MEDLAAFIDHTLLKPTATVQDVEKLCDEAEKYQFASVCVLPFYVSVANRKLLASKVSVGTVIGFPLGANLKSVKVFEAKKALQDGACELDVVINLPAFKSKDYSEVALELDELRNLSNSAILKAIIETCYLNDDEIIKACQIVTSAGFDFVKTSTGFGTSGAEVKDVELMKKSVGKYTEVKASGGIKDREASLKLIRAGASRLGSSSGVSIISEKVL